LLEPVETQRFNALHQKPDPQEVLDGLVSDLQHHERELQLEPLGQEDGICWVASLVLGTQHFSVVCQ
jgi:hypothetical protein